MVALANSRLRALASGQRYGPAAGVASDLDGGGNGILGPTCVITGNYNYIGVIDTSGVDQMVVVETATQQYTGLGFVSSTVGKANLHCTPCSIITPGGKLFTCYGNHPGGDRHLWFRRSTTTSPDDYAAESSGLVPVNYSMNYCSIYTHASTGDIYVLIQVFLQNDGDNIAAFKSTDDGVSFTYLGIIIDNTHDQILTYWGAAWSGTNTLRIFPEVGYNEGHAVVKCCEWNVVTGDIQSGSGSIGTINTSPATFASISTIWQIPGSGLARPIIYGPSANAMVDMEINETTGASNAWFAAFTGSNIYAEADWTKTLITATSPANDQTTFPQPRFWFDSMGFVSGKPRALLVSTPDAATWRLEVWEGANANGTSWSLHQTLFSGGNFSTDVIASGQSTVPSTGNLAFYMRGPFSDYKTWTTSMYWAAPS